MRCRPNIPILPNSALGKVPKHCWPLSTASPTPSSKVLPNLHTQYTKTRTSVWICRVSVYDPRSYCPDSALNCPDLQYLSFLQMTTAQPHKKPPVPSRHNLQVQINKQTTISTLKKLQPATVSIYIANKTDSPAIIRQGLLDGMKR